MSDSTVWIAACAVIAQFFAILGWLLRNERRMGTFMTRTEHDKLCDRRNVELRGSLSKIEELLAAQVQDSKDHREKVSEQLEKVRTDVAVIKDRLKHTHGEWGDPASPIGRLSP